MYEQVGLTFHIVIVMIIDMYDDDDKVWASCVPQANSIIIPKWKLLLWLIDWHLMVPVSNFYIHKCLLWNYDWIDALSQSYTYTTWPKCDTEIQEGILLFNISGPGLKIRKTQR